MRKLLVPVDFSTKSLEACRFGFDLARRLDLRPVLLHAFASASLAGMDPYSAFPMFADNPVDYEDIALDRDMDRVANRMMKQLCEKLREEINAGEIADVAFDSDVREGIPEDVIKEYVRVEKPELVVMATRGKNKKEFDLVGSVTAEVLDTCRVPVLTVPESCPFKSVESIHRLAYFCNLDGNDVRSLEFLMGMFQYPVADVTLFPVSDNPQLMSEIDVLKGKLEKQFPSASFHSTEIVSDNIRIDFENQIEKTGIEMIVVPNRKKNIFQRIFNPSIPHKLLFERDMPMLALPV